LAGGTLRDILLGNLPVGWLTNAATINVIFFSALATMLFGSYIKQLQTALFLFDALGIGLFTIIGLEIAVQKGLSASICISLGTMSACFGGVLRDVLLNKVPLLFRREIYALACVAGGTLYYFLRSSPIDDDVAKVLCIGLIFSIRWVSVRYRLMLPRFYKQDELSG